MANKSTPVPPLEARQAEELKRTYNELGPLRRELGGGGGFSDEIQAQLNAQIARLEVQVNSQGAQGSP